MEGGASRLGGVGRGWEEERRGGGEYDFHSWLTFDCKSWTLVLISAPLSRLALQTVHADITR